MSPKFRQCSACGRLVRWAALRKIGIQESGSPLFDLELRNCFCGSTLATPANRKAA